MLIRNCYCTIVRVGSIEDAIKICKRLHGKELLEGQFLKANIHPYSNYRKQELTIQDNKSPISSLNVSSYIALSQHNPLNPEFDKDNDETIKSPTSETLMLRGAELHKPVLKTPKTSQDTTTQPSATQQLHALNKEPIDAKPEERTKNLVKTEP